jgi:hypothetical protein
MKNKMLMVGAVSLVSLMTNVGFATATAQCATWTNLSGAVNHYVCQEENGTPTWKSRATATATMDNGTQTYIPNSSECKITTPEENLSYDPTGRLEAPSYLPTDSALMTTGYNVGPSGYCFKSEAVDPTNSAYGSKDTPANDLLQVDGFIS